MSRLTEELISAGKQPPDHLSEEWHALVSGIEQELGRKICAARRRNRLKPHVNGFPCERKQMPNGRCAKHGGKAPLPGPEHPNIKHGRYSRALGGTSLQDLYAETRKDPDLLALNEEISVLVAKMKQTFMKLNRGESADVWKLALLTLRRVRELINMDDLPNADRELARLEQVFETGLGDYRVWNEWFGEVEVLRKLVDTERKYREGMETNLTPERAMLMLSIWSAAAKNVLDPEQAKALNLEIARLRNATTGNRLTLAPPPGKEIG